MAKRDCNTGLDNCCRDDDGKSATSGAIRSSARCDRLDGKILRRAIGAMQSSERFSIANI